MNNYEVLFRGGRERELRDGLWCRTWIHRFELMKDWVAKAEPVVRIQNPGYQVIVYPQTEVLPGLVPRVFVLEPGATTFPMKLGRTLEGKVIERMRYCPEGKAVILIAKEGQLIFLPNLGENEDGIRLPKEIRSGWTTCLMAGSEGAVVYDLAPKEFDPRSMEFKVEFGDPSIPQGF